VVAIAFQTITVASGLVHPADCFKKKAWMIVEYHCITVREVNIGTVHNLESANCSMGLPWARIIEKGFHRTLCQAKSGAIPRKPKLKPSDPSHRQVRLK
jgi:hypothetical protein